MFIPLPHIQTKNDKKGEIFGLSFPTLMGKWRRWDWEPELSASIHTKLQIRDLRRPSTVFSVVGTVLIFAGRFVWSVSTLGVWSVVSAHVTSAISGFSVETLRAFIFIGFEPTTYGLRVLHRISACRYQTTLELIVKFTRRLGTRGTCWWWTLLINSSQRCAPGSSRASSQPKCKGSLRFQQSHGSNRVHLHFPWAALSNRGLSPYTGLLGGAQIPYASNSRALLKGDLKGILTLYKQTFRYCMFILQIQEVGWCWTWPWGTPPWLFLISAIIRCGFIFYQN